MGPGRLSETFESVTLDLVGSLEKGNIQGECWPAFVWPASGLTLCH